MKKLIALGLAFFAVSLSGVFAQESPVMTQETKAAVETTVLDYIEGWRTADAPRMEAALSPILAKRHPTANGGIENLSAKTMVGYTASGMGKSDKKDEKIQIIIHGVYGDIATVELLSSQYVDYLQLAWNGKRWLIVNVLWQYRR